MPSLQECIHGDFSIAGILSTRFSSKPIDLTNNFPRPIQNPGYLTTLKEGLSGLLSE